MDMSVYLEDHEKTAFITGGQGHFKVMLFDL